MSKAKIPVVFVVGTGHCGSTLVDLILDSHPDIFGAGELISVSENDTCDPFWRRVLNGFPPQRTEIYTTKWNLLQKKSVYYYTQSKEPVDENAFISHLEELYSRITRESGAQVIVDSSKNIERVLLLSRSDIIQPYVLHLSRDWGGVFWSYYKKYPDNFWSALLKWPLVNLKISIAMRRMRALPYLFLRYEDLCRDARVSMQNVTRWLSLPFAEDMLHFRNHAHHTVGGNRMKKSSDSTITLDEEWKRSAPRLGRTLITLLNPLFRSYYTDTQ